MISGGYLPVKQLDFLTDDGYKCKKGAENRTPNNQAITIKTLRRSRFVEQWFTD
jgi:hypothetical protein